MCAVDFDESGCPQDGRRSQESWLSIPRSIPRGPTAGAGLCPENGCGSQRPAANVATRSRARWVFAIVPSAGWPVVSRRSRRPCGVRRRHAGSASDGAPRAPDEVPASRAPDRQSLRRRDRARSALGVVTGWLGLHLLFDALAVSGKLLGSAIAARWKQTSSRESDRSGGSDTVRCFCGSAATVNL